MLSFCKDSKLPQLLVQILHEFLNAGFNVSKVVIFKLLTLWRLGTKKCSACINQILTFFPDRFINQEVFLLRTNCCNYPAHIFIAFKKAENAQGFFSDCFHRTKQRSLFIKSITCIRTEAGRNTKCTVLYESIRSRIPGSVSSGFEGGTNTTVRERRSIRFTLYKLLSGKFHNNAAVFSRLNKAVVLFGSNTSQRLEPVSVMSSAFFNRPVLHCICNYSRNIRIKLFAALNCLHQLFVSLFWKTCPHRIFIEYVFAEHFCYRTFHFSPRSKIKKTPQKYPEIFQNIFYDVVSISDFYYNKEL